MRAGELLDDVPAHLGSSRIISDHLGSSRVARISCLTTCLLAHDCVLAYPHDSSPATRSEGGSVPVVCRRLTTLLHSLLTNRRRAAVVSVNLGVTLEQSRALSALPAVQRVAVARDLVEKLGRA